MSDVGESASFMFLPHSLLKVYARNNAPHRSGWSEFYMTDILTVIYQDIRDNEMFDPTNPDILILSGDLKSALQATYLHKTELHCLVMEQAAVSMARPRMPDGERACRIQTPAAIRRGAILILEAADRRADYMALEARPLERSIFHQAIHVKSFSTSSFTITSALRSVIRVLECYNEKDSYTYTELHSYVCVYIMAKSHLIDDQNQKIIKCKCDALGEAFLVDTFHKCQLKTLITTQLVTELPGITSA